MHFLLVLAWAVFAETKASQIPLYGSSTDSIFCGEVPKQCVESKYRSYDGSCNNLQKSWWGKASNPYRRRDCNTNAARVPPIYDENLPNPRKVSLQFFVDLEVDDPLWTLLFMQYGQIIAHDFSLTAGVAQTKKDAIVCCTGAGELTKESKTNPRCAPIPLPLDDPYNAPEGRVCMDFFRVETTKDRNNCTNAPNVPEPLSVVTSWLDLSVIYGSNEDTASKVREFRGGKLAYVKRKGKMVLPQDPDPQMACELDYPSEPCYFTGDVRVNQNPELALLHIIYMQHHNRVAGQLSKVNPHWNDETLFQETRRIIIAMHQNIIYYEFLPDMIGEQFMAENKLYYPNARGYIRDYDPSVDPGVSNEFAACAFRTFHSEIVGTLRSVKESRNTSNVIQLSDWYNKPSVCEHANNFDGFTRGLATQAQSAVDRFMSNDMLNLLFKEGLLGLDLKAIDIQRGRDQGVCTYADALRSYKLLDPQNFNSLTKFISPQKVDLLAKLYKSHEDVDLCAALEIENRIPRSLVTPLSQRIIAEQFLRARVADACFYENGNGKCAFTVDQLEEIRRSGTIASILCYNSDIELMQFEALKQISKQNPLKSCRDIPRFNPRAWKEFPIG